MNQLLLSSQRLSSAKMLQTGKLDVFEALEKHDDDCASLDLSSRPPKKTLLLEWKEFITPATPDTMRDLSGKKLSEYKFQYLGRFTYGDEPVKVTQEIFEASLGNDKSIHHDVVESEGWVNCTWLVDFLVNAAAIQTDSLRDERLIWHKEGKKGHVLDLMRHSFDGKVQEEEHFIFKDDYQILEWSHCTTFNQQ